MKSQQLLNSIILVIRKDILKKLVKKTTGRKSTSGFASKFAPFTGSQSANPQNGFRTFLIGYEGPIFARERQTFTASERCSFSNSKIISVHLDHGTLIWELNTRKMCYCAMNKLRGSLGMSSEQDYFAS